GGREGPSTGGSSSSGSSDSSSSGSSGDDDGDIVIEFDDGHDEEDEEMMEDDEGEEDDDEESSDDEGEEGSDDEDAIPLLGFDGDAPRGRMYPRGGGGGHLMLPVLEDGPGRAFGIRDLLPRRRGGAAVGGATAGGGPHGADRITGVTDPNAIPPNAMLSAQSLLLPKPPRKVWSFLNPEESPDKGAAGRYSAVHPFFEGRQNNRMPPLVARPHGDLGGDGRASGDGGVDLITGVVEPPTSRSVTSMLCNRVEEAVAAGLREEPEAPTPPAETPKSEGRRRRSRSDAGDKTEGEAPRKKSRRLSRRHSRRDEADNNVVDTATQTGSQSTAAAATDSQTAPSSTDAAGESAATAADHQQEETAANGSHGNEPTTATAPADESPAEGVAVEAPPPAEAPPLTEAAPAEAAPAATEAAAVVDTSQYPQACIDAANRMRVPVGEVVRRSGMDLSVLVELPPDLQREAILDAVRGMDEGVLTELRNEYRRQNPQQQDQGEANAAADAADAAGVDAANEAAEFLHALPADLRREALISMQLDDPSSIETLPEELRTEARAANEEVEQRRRHHQQLLRRPRTRFGVTGGGTRRSGGGATSAHQREVEEQSRRLRAMGESIRGSVDNVMHSTTTSAGGGAAASSNGGGGPRQVGAYLSPFPEESASFYEDLLADDGPLVGGRRFGGTLTQRLNGAGVPGHQQLAAIIREFESVAENPDMFLFDTSRG
ncbi:E3 ubiquitin-protein ligase, partial [Perkinsus olseni]